RGIGFEVERIIFDLMPSTSGNNREPRTFGRGSVRLIANFCRASVPGHDRPLPGAAEQPVQADLDDILRFLDVNIKRGAGRSDEVIRSGAEAVVVVFNEATQVVREGIFSANTDRPSAARLACRGDAKRSGDGIVVTLPGAAAFNVTEETAPCVTD